ncbi:hypothetical protein GCM10007919_21090 [Rhizobium indigoferae]|nr:hypothetical protein GCM10007919_21090 [Rhizobium indigoferae]
MDNGGVANKLCFARRSIHWLRLVFVFPRIWRTGNHGSLGQIEPKLFIAVAAIGTMASLICVARLCLVGGPAARSPHAWNKEDPTASRDDIVDIARSLARPDR